MSDSNLSNKDQPEAAQTKYVEFETTDNVLYHPVDQQSVRRMIDGR